MSGPKSYSSEVVDTHLKVFFRFLSEVETLWDILNQRSIFDKKRNISITGVEISKPLKSLLDEIANPTFNQAGEILSQNEFDTFYNQIIKITDKQKLLIKSLTDNLVQFDKLEEAYQLYVELEAIADSYERDFEELKKQILVNLHKSLAANSRSELIVANVQQSEFAFKLPPFTIETAGNLEKERARMQKVFEASRAALIKTSKGIAMKSPVNMAVHKVQLVETNTSDKEMTLTIHQKDVLGKIKIELATLTDDQASEVFGKRLNTLQTIKNENLNFLLGELLDEIKIFKQQFHFKRTLKKIETTLNSETFDPTLNHDLEHLKNLIAKTLEKDAVKTGEMLRIKEFEAAFNKKVSESRSIRQQRAAEQNFIKARLISALQDMNFTVVADADIIDLEQTGSYLLRIPGQINYLNLRFDESGRMLYNFLIPEKKEDLSIDEKMLKLAEMEEACSEFKKMLAALQQKGLKVDMTKEAEISEKAIITMPANIRGKISTTQKAIVSSRKEKPVQQRLKPKD